MINFLKYRSLCFALSLGFLAVGAIGYFVNGFQYNVEFAGGTEFRISCEKSLDIGKLRGAVEAKGWDDAVIQIVGNESKQFLVQIVAHEGSIGDKFEKGVGTELSDYGFKVDSVNWVGPEVGHDIKWNALKAVFLSLLLILLYVAVRSKYRFAVGAVVAIAHDMLVVLGLLIVFKEQMSLHVLGAILAILGYSINDTIVIFSRVRENMKKMKGAPEEEIVNTSINQSLRRTMLTSISTLLAVGSILLLGGKALHGFSLAMFIGIIVGTYSSIYIASPVMLALKPAKEKASA
jgi:preprotein translocase subunit SecF